MTAIQERAAFIQALLRSEDVAGVFADWLEENGEAQDAALLRLPGHTHVPTTYDPPAYDDGIHFYLFWMPDGRATAARLGPVPCPCGARACLEHYDNERQRHYLCRDCYAEACSHYRFYGAARLAAPARRARGRYDEGKNCNQTREDL